MTFLPSPQQFRISFTFLLLSLLLTPFGIAQTELGKAPIIFEDPVPFDDRKMVLPLGKNGVLTHFVTDEDAADLRIFDFDMTERYRLSLLSNEYYPDYFYDPVSETVFMIEGASIKDHVYHKMTRFDAATGKVLLEKDLFVDEPRHHYSTSKNGRSIAFSKYTEKKKSANLMFTVYNADFEVACSFDRELPKGTLFKMKAVNEQGEVFLLLYVEGSNEWVFEHYDVSGKLIKSFTTPSATKKNEDFNSYQNNLFNENVVVLSYDIRNGKSLDKVYVYKADFGKGTLEQFQSESFSKEKVEALYAEVNQEHILNKHHSILSEKYKPSKTLTRMSLVTVQMDVKGNLFMVYNKHYSDDSQTGKYIVTKYFAEDIFIVAFNAKGENMWNRIIGRRAMQVNNPFVPGWSGMRTMVYIGEETIQLVTSEYANSKITTWACYRREVNKANGKDLKPKKLIEGEYYTAMNFNTWMGPDKLLLLITDKLTQIESVTFRSIDLSEMD